MGNQRQISYKTVLFCLLLFSIIVLFIYEWQVIHQDSSKNLENPLKEFAGYTNYIQPKLAESEDLVLIYNRVPKTGSTSFVNVAYDLCKKNHFRVLHINVTGNIHVLSLHNQMRFIHNVTEWDAMKPAIYHGHMAFVDFNKFGVSKPPLYINLIRKPLDRLVSYYYFLRFGDNFRPHLVRKKAGNKMSFDECVLAGMADCKPELMWLQVPFFCGHAAECWKPGSSWALEEAKRNLIRHYLVVGVTEDIENFIRVLEATLPRIFAGATKHYLTSDKSHLRVTSQKGQPSVETIAKIQETSVWKKENEFYEFALEQFKFAMKRMSLGVPTDDGLDRDKEQIFFYEKIRPK